MYKVFFDSIHYREKSDIFVRSCTQKVSGQFKTLTGDENFTILGSIIDTAIKNKQDVMNALYDVAHHNRD